jgi:hypothetical protein
MLAYPSPYCRKFSCGILTPAMQSLQLLYIGLLIFGAGVLAVDFFGGLGHDGHDGHAGHDGHDGHAGHDALDGHRDAGSALSLPERVSSGDLGARLVSRIVSTLRLAVYFSLGSGATGLFAALTGQSPLQGLAWSLGAGVAIAALSRLVRGLARRELDSSFKSEEFLMEEAEITVSVEPGKLGMAEIRKFGANVEVYVRALDPALALPKGSKVRVVDSSEEVYIVEPSADSLEG